MQAEGESDDTMKVGEKGAIAERTLMNMGEMIHHAMVDHAIPVRPSGTNPVARIYGHEQLAHPV